MSASGSALALVPPSADAPPVPFDAPVSASAAKRVGSARFRRVLSRAWATGCALLLAAPLLAAVTHNASLAGLVFGALFLLASGLPLLGLAVVERTREAVHAVVAAAAWLALAITLMVPAGRAAIEMHVAAHQAELDALATEIRTVLATPSAAHDRDGINALVRERFGDRLRRVQVSGVSPIDGGLLFRSSVGMGYTLVYADGVAGPEDACASPQLRFIGGRWFERDCPRRAAEAGHD